MWIVGLALSRPHTFIVLAIAIILFGLISLKRMAVDIFPVINLPVVSCVWNYYGLSPYYMENMVTTVTERALTSTINGIQRMESMSLNGTSIIKIYLNQGTPIGEAVAMVSSVGNAVLRQLPRNISAPFVTSSSATDVPVIQLALHSDVLSEAELFDIANNFVRTQLATVQGTITPLPYGGKYKQVVVDLDPNRLIATGLSANDVVQALQDQNVSAPSGTIKMGSYEYIVVLNNLPTTIEELNNIPVKSVRNDADSSKNDSDQVVFMRDIGEIHEGYQPQLNIVNLNGKRAVLFNVLKAGNASTLDVVQRVKDILPRIRALVPASCKIEVIVDQSKFVRDCVDEVGREAAIAAGLTALMMLALLGSWRSTVIVAVSIPLAMLCAIIGLNICGQTINSMTLGGLALAVGMLVDDATVVVENVHSNLNQGKDIVQAIMDGAEQVALPALVSTMSICIVFVPVVFLFEPSKSLFMPMGLAVVLAMMASYGLSRTIVPLMMKYLLAKEHHQSAATKSKNVFSQIHQVIEGAFEGSREKYQLALSWMLANKKTSISVFVVVYLLSFCLFPLIGQEYFPAIDAGQIRLHVNAPAGTRVEETERVFQKVEAAIRKIIPADEIEMISDNIGMPVNGLNYAYSDSQTISEADGEILVSLKEKRSRSTFDYQKAIRTMMVKKFPELNFYYQPADIVTQILNAGLPSPIDVKVIGMQRVKNFQLAEKIKQEIQHIPGTADVILHQVVDAPSIEFTVDRTSAAEMGITQNDVSNSFFVNYSSSFQTNPNFFLNTKNGVNYNLSVLTPQVRTKDMNDVMTMSVTPNVMPEVATSGNPRPSLLATVAAPQRGMTPAVVNHINVQPVFDVYATVDGRDLGSVSRDIKKILDKHQADIKKEQEEANKHAHKGKLISPTFLIMIGQVMMMNLSFMAMMAGLAFAILLVYLLLVVNFQSWTDPIIILMAIPGAFAGIMWALFVTHTNFSIPALMGAIMTVGVASANSILMVTFARSELHTGMDSVAAALSAGYQRFRPVVMTATAMIIGMIPMAIGAGSGGSQNAPIGRVVIGGLIVATFSTLFFVPLMFSIFRAKHAPKLEETKHVDS
jgi:multidrug efflux pump subunit AcrB